MTPVDEESVIVYTIGSQTFPLMLSEEVQKYVTDMMVCVCIWLDF